MVFIETPMFTRRVRELFPDEEYNALQLALVRKPEKGVVVPGSGGIRKLRWGRTGRGSRGGIRVLYYWYKPWDRIYMLLAYPKNEQEDLTPTQARILARLVREEFR